MAPFVSSLEIARPPDEVFAYVTDPSTFSDWQAGVDAARSQWNSASGVTIETFPGTSHTDLRQNRCRA